RRGFHHRQAKRFYAGPFFHGCSPPGRSREKAEAPHFNYFWKRGRLDFSDVCFVAFETSGAERRSLERLDRHGETRSNGAASARPGHARSGRISLAPGDDGSKRRENFDLAGNKSRIR